MSQLDTVRILVFYFCVANWAPALPRYASVSSWETTSPLFSCWDQQSWKAQLSPARLSSASGHYTVLQYFFTAFYLPLWGPLSWAFHCFCLHQFNKLVQFSLLSSLLPWSFLPGTGKKGEAVRTHGFLSVLWLWSIITGLFDRELKLGDPSPLSPFCSCSLLFSSCPLSPLFMVVTPFSVWNHPSSEIYMTLSHILQNISSDSLLSSQATKAERESSRHLCVFLSAWYTVNLLSYFLFFFFNLTSKFSLASVKYQQLLFLH